MSERWNFGEQPVFDCTIVIFKHGDDYFSATSKNRQNEVDVNFLATLNLQRIPTDHIFPLYESNLIGFICADRCDFFVKRPRLTAYKKSDLISRTLLEEARICEQLLASPHANIARYRSCVTRHGRVTGLCFNKYAETLWERQHRGAKISKRCFEECNISTDLVLYIATQATKIKCFGSWVVMI